MPTATPPEFIVISDEARRVIRETRTHLGTFFARDLEQRKSRNGLRKETRIRAAQRARRSWPTTPSRSGSATSSSPWRSSAKLTARIAGGERGRQTEKKAAR
jgi:hypothetical protein